MAAIASHDVTRRRGDTYPEVFRIEADGAPLDITGYTLFKLTVSAIKEPGPNDSGEELFTLTGAITDAVNGEVEYTITAGQADQTPKTYFYDAEYTDAASDIRTFVQGKWTFTQDITK